MQLLVLLLLVFAGLFWFMRWSVRVGPARTAMVLRWLAVGAIVLLLLLVMARGGGALAVPILALLLPLLLRRWRALWPAPGGHSGAGKRSRDSVSTVTTGFLHMTLDHSSGEMRGHVVAGQFQGRELNSLRTNELLAFWGECQQDPQSVSVLEAYLDRHHRDWREKLSEQQARSDQREGVSSAQEAYEILGLEPGASEADIKAAHRRLIQRLHPDHGGSSYLAARINWAKDILLQSHS